MVNIQVRPYSIDVVYYFNLKYTKKFYYFLIFCTQWEETSNGVWCCPVKVKAAVRNSNTRTGLACSLLSVFYPKAELEGKMLHELNKDVVDAIIGMRQV